MPLGIRHNTSVASYNLGEVVEILKDVFRTAIGKENGITMDRIYRGVFGRDEVNDYVKLFKINVIYGAISHMKRHTNYFITSDLNEERTRVWFVIRSKEEGTKYCNEVDSKITKLRSLKNRCIEHVTERKFNKLNEVPQLT